MKMWKKILTSAFATVMIFSLSAAPVFAAESGTTPSGADVIRGTETTYKVTLYSGNGKFLSKEQVKEYITFSDANFEYDKNVECSEDKIIISNLKANDTVSITVTHEFENSESEEILSITTPKSTEKTTINGVDVAGEVYYAKGFVKSGKTNSDPEEQVSISIKDTGDVDYVVAYGIAGNQVIYTVKYQDKDGKALAKDDLFYGNVGEKPIVAYKRIAGYAPTVVAFTKTLSGNVAENVFTFVYDKVPTEKVSEVVTEETEYDYVTVGGETSVIGGGTSAGTASNVTGGGNVAGENTGNQDIAGAGAGTEAPIVEESQIVDLDDEETPLANIEIDADEEAAGSSVGVYAALGLLAVITVAVVAYVASKKKKVQE